MSEVRGRLLAGTLQPACILPSGGRRDDFHLVASPDEIAGDTSKKLPVVLTAIWNYRTGKYYELHGLSQSDLRGDSIRMRRF